MKGVGTGWDGELGSGMQVTPSICYLPSDLLPEHRRGRVEQGLGLALGELMSKWKSQRSL